MEEDCSKLRFDYTCITDSICISLLYVEQNYMYLSNDTTCFSMFYNLLHGTTIYELESNIQNKF